MPGWSQSTTTTVFISSLWNVAIIDTCSMEASRFKKVVLLLVFTKETLGSGSFLRQLQVSLLISIILKDLCFINIGSNLSPRKTITQSRSGILCSHWVETNISGFCMHYLRIHKFLEFQGLSWNLEWESCRIPSREVGLWCRETSPISSHSLYLHMNVGCTMETCGTNSSRYCVLIDIKVLFFWCLYLHNRNRCKR